jgi:L-lactate dehydrogenase complex protein LldG
VSGVSVRNSAEAGLGVTSAVAAIATTGTVVQDSHAAGGRSVSLLPPVHLCVLPASRIVATSAEVLRPLGDGRTLPSNLVLVTGPSRSGDIEQIMTLGVHGPLAVEIALLRRA